MEQAQESAESMPTEASSQRFRLLIVGLVVPVVVAIVDHFLIQGLIHDSLSVERIAVTLALFVAQIGVLGVLCGGLLAGHMRWIIYGWTWLLIDALAIISLVVVRNEGLLLVASLFATQAGLLIVWAMLGSGPWLVRSLIGLAAGILFAWPLVEQRDWLIRYVTQTVSLLVICLGLWMRGYRLRQISAEQENLLSPGGHAAPSMQFGIRHVMVWTTVLAATLGVLRALGLLSWWVVRGEGATALGDGLIVAIVLVVAMWAALGSGRWWLRCSTLLLFVVIGGVVATYLRFWELSRMQLVGPSWRWPVFVAWHWWLITWFCLAGGLMFAALLFFRALGYRLTRFLESTAAR